MTTLWVVMRIQAPLPALLVMLLLLPSQSNHAGLSGLPTSPDSTEKGGNRSTQLQSNKIQNQLSGRVDGRCQP